MLRFEIYPDLITGIMLQKNTSNDKFVELGSGMMRFMNKKIVRLLICINHHQFGHQRDCHHDQKGVFKERANKS